MSIVYFILFSGFALTGRFLVLILLTGGMARKVYHPLILPWIVDSRFPQHIATFVSYGLPYRRQIVDTFGHPTTEVDNGYSVLQPLYIARNFDANACIAPNRQLQHMQDMHPPLLDMAPKWTLALLLFPDPNHSEDVRLVGTWLWGVAPVRQTKLYEVQMTSWVRRCDNQLSETTNSTLFVHPTTEVAIASELCQQACLAACPQRFA